MGCVGAPFGHIPVAAQEADARSLYSSLNMRPASLLPRRSLERSDWPYGRISTAPHTV